MKYTIDTISSLDEFEHLKEAWNTLLEHDTRYLPYLSHEWFQLWFSYFKDQDELLIVHVKEGDQTVAIFPFVKRKAEFKGLPVTEIELAGNEASPVRCFLFRPMDDGKKALIIARVLRSLGETTSWDVLKLLSLPEEILNVIMLVECVQQAGYRFTKSLGFGNWYTDDIDFSGEEYIQSRNRNIKTKVKKYKNKTGHFGKLDFQLITGGSEAQTNAGMDLYYDVFKNSWKDWELHPTFHRDLALLSNRQGWLRLGLIMLDVMPIAAQFSQVCDGISYCIRSFYDERYKKMSPGVILHSELKKYIIDVDKVKEIDFLIGDEAYKKDWMSKRRERLDVVVFNNTVKGRMLAFLVLNLIPFAEKNAIFQKFKTNISKLLGIN